MSHPPCRCGEPATERLYLRYRRPRENFDPEAVDPWYVHGSWPAITCGSPACEAEEYAELLATHPGAEVAVRTDPDEGIFVVGESE